MSRRNTQGLRIRFFLDFGDKTITTLGQRFDEARRLGGISQNAPDLEDVFSEHLRLDKRVRPQCLKQLFRGHQPADVINQETGVLRKPLAPVGYAHPCAIGTG